MATPHLLPNASNQLRPIYSKFSTSLLASRKNHSWANRISIGQLLIDITSNRHRLISSSSLHHDKATNNAAATDATDTTVGEAGEVKSKLAANVIKPKPLFPWRHSPHQLPRLIPPDESQDEIKYNESDYFAKGGHLGPGWPRPMPSWFQTACQANSMRLLGLPYSSMLIPWTRNAWLHDMEDAFCDAFGKGVNGLILDSYSMEDLDVTTSDGEFDIDFDHTILPNPLIDTENKDTTTDTLLKEQLSEDEEQNSMLQYSLRNLYQSARQHSHPNKVNIVLRTQPQYAVIESMFPVFGMSRSLVQNHPNLRHSYRNLVKEIQHKEREVGQKLNPVEVGKIVMNGFLSLMERSAQLSSDGKGVITIIAQVSIQCREIFCVKDVESGEVLQGEGDGQSRDVTHLVRFEIVLKENFDKGPWDMDLGRWQITDWDDLLEGNVWFT